jgi:glycosyltransferase involved in cell wall biosynthesis
MPQPHPLVDASSIGIIAVVVDFWKDMWQVRHHLMSHIAERSSVVWLNPAHHWRSTFRPRSISRPPDGAIPPGARLRVFDAPLWLPRFHGKGRLDAMTFAARLRAARAQLIKDGAKHIVLYIWRPMFAQAPDLIAHDFSIYHIDDEYSFSKHRVETSEEEMGLLKRVDQVLIHAPTMMRAKGHINPHTEYLPNGVDYLRYSTAAAEPRDLANISRPRIGYTGWLKPQIDWPLLQTLVRSRPEWSFVFVGPHRRSPEIEQQVELLGEAPNVHLLGGRPTSELHAYNQHMDVCLMPYEVNGYTEFIYPIKVHEYLATGNPVVASRLPNLLDLKDVLFFADHADNWLSAISEALATRSDEQLRAARRRVAQQHDWATLANRVISIVQARLGARVSFE